MKVEFVDILDSQGNYTGRTCSKKEAHVKGYFHPTVHVWIYTRNREVLFQKRSVTKDTFPGRWDVSAAGHVHAGERIEDAALREVQEELGLILAPEDLVKTGVFKSECHHENKIIDREFHHTFLVLYRARHGDFILQEDEVEAIRFIPVNEVLETPFYSQLVPNEIKYYREIMDRIKQL